MVGRCAGSRDVSSAWRMPTAAARPAGTAATDLAAPLDEAHRGCGGRAATGRLAAGHQCRARQRGYAGRRWPPVAWRDR